MTSLVSQLPQIACALFAIGAMQLAFGFAGEREWRASRWVGVALLAGSLAACGGAVVFG